jgi:hypothetical protein
VKSNSYLAVERTADFIKELNKEQTYQQSGAVDDNQISRLGKQFGVQLVCVAKVGKVGEKQFVSARLIDVETATVKSSTTPVLFTLDDMDKSCAAVAVALISGDPVNIQSSTTSDEAAGRQTIQMKHGQSKTNDYNSLNDAVKNAANIIAQSCKKPERYNSDEAKFKSLKKLTSKVALERFINSNAKFPIEPTFVNENEISFFLRSRKSLRTQWVAYIPMKVDDCLLLFLDGKLIGTGLASTGLLVTLPKDKFKGQYILSLHANTFPIFNISVDLSAKNYYLFDWSDNKKVYLID